MDFHTFVRIIGSRWKVVLTAIVVCAAAAVAITMVQPKSYQASATILVSFDRAVTINDAYEGTQAAQHRLSSYAEIAGGRTVAERALAQLGVPLTADQLVENTTVTYTPDSTLFRLTVADTDPQRAAALAAAMSHQFAELVPELDTGIQVGQPTVPVVGSGLDGQQTLVAAKATVVEQPMAPQHAASPVPARNVALGLVAGVLLGVALALARDATDRTVRNRENLTARSGLPTLAQLPPPGKFLAANRSGGGAKPSDLVYDEEVRRLRTALLGTPTSPVRSVLVTAPTLGQGATTTALRLALSFTEVDETVLLVEGDPRQPTIASLVEVESEAGLADVLADPQILDDAVQPTSHAGLWVLASTKPSDFKRSANTLSLATTLEKLAAGFDRIVIDGPPALVIADTGMFAAAVDATVLVVRCGRTGTDEVDGALDNLGAAKDKAVGAVLTGAKVPSATLAAATAYRAKVNESATAALRVVGS